MARYLILVLEFFLFTSVSSALGEEQIPIGISAPLTGVASTYGTDIKNVLIFANEKIGGGRFKLIIEDDKCNGKDAVTVAKKMVNVDKVRGVIGYGCSGALLAAAPIYEASKVPVIGTTTSAKKISNAGDYIFRTQPSDGEGVKVFYQHLIKHHKVLGALNAETDFAQGIIEDLTHSNANGPLRIESENVLSSDMDFKSVLLKLRSRKIDALFVNAQDEIGTYRMIRQAKELGIDLPFYTFYNGASNAFFKVARSDAEGVYSIDVPSLEDIANAEGVALYDEFTEQYGPIKSWTYSFVSVFEAFRALTYALTKGEDAKTFLNETSFNGIFGPYSFDANGDIIGISLVMKKNKNGRAEIVTW